MIDDTIISKGFYFNISQKPKFKKIIDLAKNLSKGYRHPNRNLTYKDLQDIIHDHNMESNIILIEK